MKGVLLTWILSANVLLVVLILLRQLLRRRLPARLVYAFWAVALVRLLIPVSLFSSPWSMASAARNLVENSKETAVIAPAALPEQEPLKPSVTAPAPAVPTRITVPEHYADSA